jgi:hypothetical protein
MTRLTKVIFALPLSTSNRRDGRIAPSFIASRVEVSAVNTEVLGPVYKVLDA